MNAKGRPLAGPPFFILRKIAPSGLNLRQYPPLLCA